MPEPFLHKLRRELLNVRAELSGYTARCYLEIHLHISELFSFGVSIALNERSGCVSTT